VLARRTEEELLQRLQRKALQVASSDHVIAAVGGNIRRAVGMMADHVIAPRHTGRYGFCGACYGRGYQLVEAVPVNCVMLWPWRATCDYFITIFKDNEGDWQKSLASLQDDAALWCCGVV
jgi:hypothetical protein